MSKMIRTADLPVEVAAELFEQLNPGRVKIQKTGLTGGDFMKVIMINVRPDDLYYPDGWYYVGGKFTNKHTSSTGRYQDMNVVNEDWSICESNCCTLPEDYPLNS